MPRAWPADGSAPAGGRTWRCSRTKRGPCRAKPRPHPERSGRRGRDDGRTTTKAAITVDMNCPARQNRGLFHGFAHQRPEGYPSGQRGQTVNLLAYAFGGSNPPPSTNRRSEEHTSELQSLMRISYAVFCLKKKKKTSQSQKHSTQADIGVT